MADLSRLEELLAKATSLPWMQNIEQIWTWDEQTQIGECWAEERFDDDAALIVEAINALPSLIARIRELEGALIDHNDQLRSAAQVAARDGKDTNWLTFRGAVHYTLAEHQETVNSARRALSNTNSENHHG